MTKPKRKLAAIVFTDIVGFTELSAKNEPAALELLNKQRDILKPIVKNHEGEWLKEIGDGLLLTFNTNIEAVLCSIAIQEAAKSIPELDLRIGIHQGEVVFQGDDVVGDDVNIASRIEPFSASGGIAISGRVNASLERDPEFETTFIGKPALKGVSQEIKVYCITSHGLPMAFITPTGAKLEPERRSFFKKYVFPITGGLLVLLGGIFWFLLPLLTIGSAIEIPDYEKRIAVLYLENRGSEEDLYLSDGLTEEIITRLSRIEKLSVVSRFDVYDYKGKKINLDEIRDDLEADYLLTGSLMKFDEEIKISVELVDLKKRDVEWSTSLEKNMDDIFAIQDEIAINIVENLDITLRLKDKESVMIDPSASVKAYNELLQIGNIHSSSIQDEIERLNNIIEVDNTYADAFGMRSILHLNAMIYDFRIDRNKAIEQAKNDAEMALLYDEKNLYGLLGIAGANILHVYNLGSLSSKILSARKGLVNINILKKYHPDHYFIDLIMGAYNNVLLSNKNISNPNNYEELKKYWESFIKKTKNKINTDKMARAGSQLVLRDLAVIELNHHNYSSAIFYAELLNKQFEDEDNIERLVAEFWIIKNPKYMIGDYDDIINRAMKIDELSKQVPINNIANIDRKITMARCYSELGQLDLAVQIINELDKEKIKEQKYKDIIAWHYHTAAYIYDAYDDKNKAAIIMKDSYNFLLERNSFSESNRPPLLNFPDALFMDCQSYLAKYYAEKGEIKKAKNYINELENIIPDPSEMHWVSKIQIYHNLVMTYRILDNKQAYNKYLNIAYKEIIKISDLLDDKHREMYFNNVRINREIVSMKQNI